MTDRSRRIVGRGHGLALAVIALTAFGVSAQAASAPKQSVSPRNAAEASRLVPAATVTALPQAGRVHIDIDPIDPSVRHTWPDLSDSASSELMHRAS